MLIVRFRQGLITWQQTAILAYSMQQQQQNHIFI